MGSGTGGIIDCTGVVGEAVGGTVSRVVGGHAMEGHGTARSRRDVAVRSVHGANVDGLWCVIVVGAEFMSGRPDRIVTCQEVNTPESGSLSFAWAL